MLRSNGSAAGPGAPQHTGAPPSLARRAPVLGTAALVVLNTLAILVFKVLSPPPRAC